MSGFHSSLTWQHLEKTIRELYPFIERRIKANATNHWCEYHLRKEIVGCILGSQVRHEVAIAWTENIEQAGLLDDNWWSDCRNDEFSTVVLRVLSGERQDLPQRGSYRFPKTRASQLTRARDTLVCKPLSARLANSKSPGNLRQSLVVDIPGLGPKQASMFLRNIGKSYDLAILDTHVLSFMEMQNLLCINQVQISTIAGYERVEKVVVDYAATLDYPVGYLDWAIWATMKAARELGL